MTKQRGIKLIFTIGGLLLFLAGIIIGSFLVLRSATSQGKLYTIENEVLKDSSNFTQELLDELNLIQELPPEQFEDSQVGNITQDFLETISREGDLIGLDIEGYTDEIFLESIVLPYLVDNQINLLERTGGFEPQTTILTDPQEYIGEIKIHFLVLAGAWQKIISTAPEDLNDPKVKEDFEALVKLLTQNDKELRDKKVPLQYGEFHKKVVALSTAIQQIVVGGMVNKKEDPLRALLVMVELDKVEQFAQALLSELVLIEELNI